MKNLIPPWVRVSILISSLFIAGLISRFLTGSFLPERPGDTLIFQNAILLIVLGSTLLEYHYTKPADSLVNALTAIVTLIPVYNASPSVTWWVVFGYCLAVLVLSTICVASSSGKNMTGWQRSLADFTYTPSTYFGNARLLYSIVFLFAVFTFYGIQTIQTVTLVIFWAFFIVIWPLGLPEFFSKLSTIGKGNNPIGSVSRTDWPNIVRVSLEPVMHFWE